ncbi:MAG: sulfurtransferase FdhD [Deltaproteobacteria bacterium]|nr:sulfurtransferase FdhD [Deltaproteobacteria bacterium]
MVESSRQQLSRPVLKGHLGRKGAVREEDLLVIEEPLEIRLECDGGSRAGERRSIAVTMRTPGHDRELALGFLVTEGILTHRSQVCDVTGCGPEQVPHGGQNIVRVKLRPGVLPDLSRIERNFYTTSSCGICGKASLDAVMAQGVEALRPDDWRMSHASILRLPELMRAHQPVFAATGANHGALLVSPSGSVIFGFEDVGRHNAVDKVIGAAFLASENLRELTARSVLVVSGRAGFELVQKALVAKIPAMVAVGAPSSLSVELASRFGMTLIGFVRNGRFNIYAGEERIDDI